MAPTLPPNDGLGSSAGPLGEAMRLFARDKDDKPHKDPSKGVLDPHDISNVGFFVLFALIGIAFVAAGIWFFFWAKNGGFYFKKNDWDDYKTAVLRRRGPNGTIYSDVTPSTDLGGGSVYKDVDDDKRTTITDSTGLSGITAGASDVGAREKREEKRRQKKKQREEKIKGKDARRHVGEDGVTDEFAEKKAKDELRSYRHERPARVGGLNKESDGSTWDGSTNPTSSTVDSELLSNKQSTPENTPKKKGIRKVYSTADRNDARESERIRAEARRLREEGGRSHKRDFSFQRAAPTDSLLSGTTADTTSEVGTKSYHHSRPELREQRQKEREERRARRGGYRRGRGDDDEL